jgi:uncharacterized protein YbjT (DUF2867 family)
LNVFNVSFILDSIKMNIFLAGASGFVGERVLSDVIAAGHSVIAHVHSDRSAKATQDQYPAIRAVQCDMGNSAVVSGIIPERTDAVIWLPGLLRESPKHGQTFERVHIAGVRNLLAEAKRAGVKRWIQMSALGVNANGSTGYFRTKWQAEELVRASKLDWTILRPSLIFDDRPRRQHSFVSEIVKAIRMAPFVPILGKGDFLFQPVSVDDVSQTILQSLTMPSAIGSMYEMGGPEKITYRELARTIARGMHTKKPAVHIPLFLISAFAQLLGRFSWFPITPDEIVMLKNGNYIRDPREDAKWREAFDLPMKRFSESVKKALS